MLNSLELRSPFLDNDIIDFTFKSVPTAYKVNKNGRKLLLSELAKSKLPKNFDYKRKQGFSIPINSFINNEKVKDLIKDELLNKNCIFNSDFILELLKSLKKNRKNEERLMGLLFFEIWRKKHKIIYK